MIFIITRQDQIVLPRRPFYSTEFGRKTSKLSRIIHHNQVGASVMQSTQVSDFFWPGCDFLSQVSDSLTTGRTMWWQVSDSSTRGFRLFIDGCNCAIQSCTDYDADRSISSFVEERIDIIRVLLFPCHMSKGKTKACAQLVHEETDICFLIQTWHFKSIEAPPQ